MENTVATISNLASAEEYTTVAQKVDEVDTHLKYIQDYFATLISEHYLFHQEEKKNYNEEISQIKHDLHNLRVALRWAVAGLLCSGIAILALCIHLIS